MVITNNDRLKTNLEPIVTLVQDNKTIHGTVPVEIKFDLSNISPDRHESVIYLLDKIYDFNIIDKA